MSEPWLSIVGIGEEGLEGLNPSAHKAVTAAEVIVGGKRHHALTQALNAERITWPSPFNHMLEALEGLKGRPTCVLVTGDPVWYSAGTKIADHFGADDIRIHPHVSAFQLACVRMGWALQDAETLTVHGRAVGDILSFVAPRAKLVVLTQDGDTPSQVAELLSGAGYGDSRMTVLADMGGANETRLDGVASRWSEIVPSLHTLCVECSSNPDVPTLPRGPGLPDDAFEHDGKMTKRDLRAITLAKLAPRPDELLWDVGAGCGSVGIEWMRSARGARSIGLEPHAERRAMAERNAHKLGTSRFELVDGTAPDALSGLDKPDAVFIGGGLSQETVDASLAALKNHGRLVANAVTLESEQLLIQLHQHFGGELTRISIAHADAVGRYRGWRSAMPITQWSLVT
ncbi:MAG: precorrin-6y C5,15-methyltransferase (decarboxylating) subunit CbiE [Cohaesibacteraceae bacterium]